ncbi:MAG: tetratricopeptide repeat protein, partial [Candidatus Omnitrophica bacterium]|nr:tetratricopeptide repeat protein [Candidatus Omnitrophota bacterium]
QKPDKKTENKAGYFLGLSELRLGNYDEAKSIFEKLSKLQLDPNLQDKVYLGLFDVYYLQENYSQAQDVVRELIKENPKSEFLSLAYLKLARVCLKQADWSDARSYLKKIINNYPDSLEVHSAQQLLEEKQYFAVQVGSFLERERAQKLVDKLTKRHEYAYIVETKDISGKMFYRVRVGQLSLLNEAKELRSKLSGQGYPTAIYP